jgi:hypothetical protein
MEEESPLWSGGFFIFVPQQVDEIPRFLFGSVATFLGDRGVSLWGTLQWVA